MNRDPLQITAPHDRVGDACGALHQQFVGALLRTLGHLSLTQRSQGLAAEPVIAVRIVRSLASAGIQDR